jgi:hypothetical protein
MFCYSTPTTVLYFFTKEIFKFYLRSIFFTVNILIFRLNDILVFVECPQTLRITTFFTKVKRVEPQIV